MACLHSYIFPKHRVLIFPLGISIFYWICLGWRKDELSDEATGKLRAWGWGRGSLAALSPPGIKQANGEITQANLPNPRAIILLCVWVIVRRERFIGILSTLTQQIFIEHLPYSELCSVFRNRGCKQVILPHYSQTLLFWTASRPHPKYQSMYWLNVYMCKISYRADIVNICKVRLGNLEEVDSL